MISIDIKIDGKRLDYYSTHWDAISNKLIIELDSKELKQTQEKLMQTQHNYEQHLAQTSNATIAPTAANPNLPPVR